MKIFEPSKFFAGTSSDPNYSENYNNSLLMARGDILCQYSKEEVPTENSWISYKEILDSSIYKWIRLSFDKGLTWAITFQINNESILTFSFLLNNENLTDNLENSNNEVFNKRYTYQLQSKEEYESIKNNNVSVYLNENKTNISILAPIVYREENNFYYLDILFTDSFVTQQLNKTCIVKVLKSTIQNNILGASSIYTTPSAQVTISDPIYGQIGILNESTTFSLNCYKEVHKLRLRIISSDASVAGNIVINAFNETFIIHVNETLTWVDLIPKTKYEGLITLIRNTNSELDTLKKNDEIISAKIIDWQLY